MLNLELIFKDLDPTGKLAQHFYDSKIITLLDIYYWISDLDLYYCEKIENSRREARLLFKILKDNNCLIQLGAKRSNKGCKKSYKFIKLLRKIIDEQQ